MMKLCINANTVGLEIINVQNIALPVAKILRENYESLNAIIVLILVIFILTIALNAVRMIKENIKVAFHKNSFLSHHSNKK